MYLRGIRRIQGTPSRPPRISYYCCYCIKYQILHTLVRSAVAHNSHTRTIKKETHKKESLYTNKEKLFTNWKETFTNKIEIHKIKGDCLQRNHGKNIHTAKTHGKLAPGRKHFKIVIVETGSSIWRCFEQYPRALWSCRTKLPEWNAAFRHNIFTNSNAASNRSQAQNLLYTFFQF